MAVVPLANLKGPTGRTGPRGIPGRDGAARVVEIPSATTEWWIGPAAVQLSRPYPRILTATYGVDGSMQVSESVPGAGTRTLTVREPVGWTVDDHDAPAIWAEDGHRPLIMWTRHGDFNPTWLVVGDREATIESLAVAPVQELVTTSPELASNYVQIFRIRHLSTVDGDGLPLVDYFWAFTRRGDRWQVIKFTINQASGAYTFVSRQTVVTLTGLQAYATVSETYGDTQEFRLAAASNPDSAQDGIWYLEVDPTDGQGRVTSPLDGSVDYVLGTDDTGVAVYAAGSAAVTPLIADSGSTSVSRRLFYTRPGPALPAIAWAQWDPATPDAATYKLTEWNGSSWVTTDLGPAGPRFGYVATSNYLAGMCFADPSPTRDVWLCRNGAESTLERSFINRAGARETEILEIAGPGHTLVRPFHARNGSPAGVMFTDLASYAAGAFTFQGDVKSLGSNVSARAVTASEPLVTEGSMVYVDFSHPDFPTFGVPGTVKNLAAAELAKMVGWGAAADLTLESTMTSATGIVERTRLGGLHVAAKQSGTTGAERLLLKLPAGVVTWINDNWSDDLYVGVIAAVTRKRLSGGTAIPAWVGLRGTSTGATEPQWAALYPAASTGNIASSPTTSERVGFQNAIVDTVGLGNPFLADVAVNRRPTTWASTLSDILLSLGNVTSGYANNAMSAITYVVYVENLTVSGRSYQRVNAAMQRLLESGRFTGDNYTLPTSL